MNNLKNQAIEEKNDQEVSLIDPMVEESFFELAESLNLSERQTTQIWDWIVQGASEFVQLAGQEVQDYCCQAEKELQEKFGEKYEVKKKEITHLIHQYGGQEFTDMLKNTGLANRKELVLFLINLAEVFGEDRGLVGEKSAEFSSQEMIQDQLSKIMASSAYMQARHPDHKRSVEKAYSLRQKMMNEEK